MDAAGSGTGTNTDEDALAEGVGVGVGVGVPPPPPGDGAALEDELLLGLGDAPAASCRDPIVQALVPAVRVGRGAPT